MNNKQSIFACGWGRESAIILQYLLKKKIEFTVVTCIGKKDSVNEYFIKTYCKLINKKCIIIKKSFVSQYDLDFNTRTIIGEHNPIIDKFPNDIIISGRLFKDFKKRMNIILSTKSKPFIPNFIYPMWHNKLTITKREEKILKEFK